MFNVRFGYYLGAICIFPIILWYDGIKNTLFRKNNTRLHILSGMIGILIITLPAIFLIFNLPPTYNRIIKTVTGEVVKRQCIGTGYLNGLAAYSIILDDKDTNKIYNFPDVIGIENELKKGDEIEIYLYEFYGAQSRIITKVNGKELYYIKQDHPFNKTLEKFIGIGTLNGHAIYMVYCAYREYIQGGRKKRGKGWCIITCATAGIYGLLPWITYKMIYKGRQLGTCLVILFIIYVIERYILAWTANIDEHWEEWNNIPLNEAAIKEEKRREKERAKQQLAEEEAEQQRMDEKKEKKRQKRQLILEADNVTEHQFQQMSYYMTKQYCDYKFQKRMKNSIEGVALIAVLELAAAFVIPAMYDKLYKWYGYVAGAGVIIAILIFAVGYVLVCRKNKKFKEAANAGYPLEYCIVIADVYNMKKFICSDGHMEEWKMRSDDDAKVKDGEEAVVIYSPSTHEMFTERKEVMNKVCGIENNQETLEESNSPIYQFQQMEQSVMERYFNYKFQKRMMNSMKGGIVFTFLVFMAAILIPLIYDDLFKWYVYILVVGIIVANLVFVISFAIAYHKNKKYKNITNIKYPLEYCTVIVDIYNSREFICSDGHKEEWKMRCDNGTKVKNGQEAIVIYSPSTQEIFIERKEVMNKICGI
ncbi:MAG: hypothetical protein V8Q92_00095 [Coprococcus comes]